MRTLSTANPGARGLSRIKWLYAENRVLHPMKRVGERGEGKFVAITWDEALDTIAGKIKEAIAKDGANLCCLPALPEIWTIFTTRPKLHSVIISAEQPALWGLCAALP